MFSKKEEGFLPKLMKKMYAERKSFKTQMLKSKQKLVDIESEIKRRGPETNFEKITPETYEKMNEEFEEEGLAFRIIVPTQEQIDEWRQRD